MRPESGLVGRARRWYVKSSYLDNVALVFTVVTVVNSAMMVAGWDTPKTGTFAYTHLLSRLAIVAAVVALFHLDDLRQKIERWRHRDRRRRSTTDRGKHSRAVELLTRQIPQAPLDRVTAAFTVVTGVLCSVALSPSVWEEPQGGVALYRALLVLAAALALMVGGWTWWHRSRQAHPGVSSSSSRPGSHGSRPDHLA